MQLIHQPKQLQQYRQSIPTRQRVGFVPTMGCLHEGHLALLKYVKQQCDTLILSIFINPTQFNQSQDFEQYPKTLADDIAAVEPYGVDALFVPDYQAMYADNYTIKVQETSLASLMEGAHRPGHFDGVLTIVMKLFNLVKPHMAVFGEKDYQQYLLIKKMCESLFMDIKILSHPIIRDASGLALSSRNTRLSAEQLQIAPSLYHALKQDISLAEIKRVLIEKGFKVDYIEEREGRRFAAVFLGEVRLIDNIPLSEVGAHVIGA